jgi:hypothetical protein
MIKTSSYIAVLLPASIPRLFSTNVVLIRLASPPLPLLLHKKAYIQHLRFTNENT